MILIKLAYYKKRDWDRFLSLIDDKESVENSWHDWNRAFEAAKTGLKKQGFEVIEVVVDLDELTEYCKIRGIKNDGRARSQFVQAK